MAQTKMLQVKEKDFDLIVPRFSYCDMPEEIRKFVVDSCREAYKKQHDGELKYYKDLAIHIKKTLDKKEGMAGAWHIIVGKSSLTLISCRNKFRIFCELRTQVYHFVLVGAYRFFSFQTRLIADRFQLSCQSVFIIL